METNRLRTAGPNEKRCIVRHALGYYNNIVVGARYSLAQEAVTRTQLAVQDFYFPAVKECIEQHAFLSLTVHDADSKESVWVRPESLDLQKHLKILEPAQLSLELKGVDDEEKMILDRALDAIHNRPEYRFESVDSQPAWALHILLLPENYGDRARHYFIAFFTYSHSHGDGLSGVAFHRTFHAALQKMLESQEATQETLIIPPKLALGDDISGNISISMRYLVSVVLEGKIPRFVNSVLGTTKYLCPADEKTWTGSIQFVEEGPDQRLKAKTSVEIVTLRAESVSTALALCKKNGTTLTPLLNFLLARAFAVALRGTNGSSVASPDSNFVSQVPISLRKAAGLPNEAFGIYAGGTYLRYDIASFIDSEPSKSAASAGLDAGSWKLLKSQSGALARSASSLYNQSLGLLRFVPDLSSWLQGQVGKPREGSWEFSNVGSFQIEASSVKVEQMFFSQSACPIQHPINFNVASVKGGDLNIIATWQIGALGSSDTAVPAAASGEQQSSAEQVDRAFVRGIFAALQDSFDHLA